MNQAPSSGKSPVGQRPLHGVKVLEIESIGPGPFAAMLLADLGANVLKVIRPGERPTPNPVLDRNRAGEVAIDLKVDEGRRQVLDLIGKADALIEGFRPGVMERLGLGPDECLSKNSSLIYGRITGWGREGPLAQTAGHDINYISLSGALYSIGTADSGPIPPLNLAGDYGGGGLLLALGIVTALFQRNTSGGDGQVVDAAMIDGSAILMAPLYGLLANRRWKASRANNLLDGSAYYYRCYQCADGGWVSVGPLEAHFRRTMLELLGFGDDADRILRGQPDDPDVHKRLETIFRQHPRSHWVSVFKGSDACVAPVLSMTEVIDHPQNRHRKTFREIDGVVHPTPAPRFSSSMQNGMDGIATRRELLAAWNLDNAVVP